MARASFLFLLLFLGLRGPAAECATQAVLGPEPYFSQIAERFSRRFPQEHLTQAPMDAAVSSRAWTNYITSLDLDHVYFLASDIEKFKADVKNLDDQLDKGDLSFAYRVFAVFKFRVEDRHEYTDKLLEKGFDLDKQETYKWRRKEVEWPKDEAEWNEIWRQRIKNEYVRRVVAMELSGTNKIESGSVESEKDDEALSPMEAIRKQSKQYVTIVEDADPAWILEKYLSAFAHAYDPHSDYMSASSMEDFDIEMKLSLVGIGALLSADEDGAAKVVRIIPGGPADLDKREIRLKPGDRIIMVGEGDDPPVDIRHWPLHKIVERIRGEKGSKVTLIVVPASDLTGSTQKRVDLVRNDVRLEDQAASGKTYTIKGGDGVTRNLGVITLPAFYANMRQGSVSESDYRSCCSDMERILGDMKEKNVEGILLDLRNNGGGSLAEVVKMTGLFVHSGPVVQVKEMHSQRKILRDDDGSIRYNGPLVVLVNRLSASASEILAGALQDYRRAVIVGDSKTHGKGTVQTILDLGRDPKYGAIKITTAMYYRISGSSTQLKGVCPDIVVPSAFDCMDFGEEFETNPMKWDRIDPASYSADTNMPSIISVLAGNSEKRRAADPRFAANTKFLDRVRTLNKTQELPLDLATRKKMAETEKDLSELEEKITEPGENGNKDNPLNNDLVLSEGLQILTDCVSLEPKIAAQSEPASDVKRSAMDSIIDWLRN
jgi:carboxyl-terminal processing protease